MCCAAYPGQNSPLGLILNCSTFEQSTAPLLVAACISRSIFLRSTSQTEKPLGQRERKMAPSDPTNKELAAAASDDNSDNDTLSNSYDYEQGREDLRNSNPQGLTRTQSEVNVEKAVQDFADLNRQLSGISHQTRRLSKQISRASKGGISTQDVEKTGSSTDSEEPWDLETALHGSRVAENDAGIRPKRIGIFSTNYPYYKVATCSLIYRCNMGRPHCQGNWRGQKFHQNIPRCHCRFLQRSSDDHAHTWLWKEGQRI